MNILANLFEGAILTASEAESIMDQIFSEKLDPVVIASLLSILKMRGEHASEIVGFAKSAIKHCKIQQVDGVVDVCGTGGDNLGTFNISTATAIVLAAAKVPIAKHGNRAVSGKCGSADVLQALGISISGDEEKNRKSLKKNHFAFYFAPNFHQGFKVLAPIRKSLGVKTLFNLLGPLVNPLNPPYQLIGVYDLKLIEVIAEVLIHLGRKRAIVVASEDGLDEFSISSRSHYAFVSNGKISKESVVPEDVGLQRHPKSELLGGDAQRNAEMLTSALKGEFPAGVDVICLNAAAALLAADRVNSLSEGVELARKIIQSGQAIKKLEELKKYDPAKDRR